jgi:GNAT superfamily N-acetyltransferase
MGERPTAPEAARLRPEALGVRHLETPDGLPTTIGPIRAEDREPLFQLFSEIVEKGEGFPHEPPLTAGQFEATWIEPVALTVTARVGERLVGAYYLKANFVGRASHIANAGYVVAGRWRGRGIGRLLLEDSVRRAPSFGFDAIQFNLVFESNPARALYEALGWTVIGRLPRAVGGEDCLVYWREVV